MLNKSILNKFSLLPFLFSFGVHANTPDEKFSYCSNGVCRIATNDDFYNARGMPRDLNVSCKKNNHYALTFDDGPSVNYPRLREILKKHNVKATFFIVGSNLSNEDARNYYAQMAADGHFMANHTLNHTDLTTITPQEIFEQAQKSREALLNAASLEQFTLSPELLQQLEKSSKYVRPPYGNINSKVDKVFKENGFVSIRWNADRYDWSMRTSEESKNTIVQRVLQQLDFIKSEQEKGQIFNTSMLDLNHDFQTSTLDALEIIIPIVKARGYEFVTMDECVN